jgi:ribonuclease HI
MIEVWFDGACEPVNPGGTVSCGVVVQQDGATIWEHSDVVVPPNGCQTSNNLAEYAGFATALRYLLEADLTGERIAIFGDSQLVIKQMMGRYRIQKGAYVPLALHAKRLMEQFVRQPMLMWIPREQNTEADRLSKAPLIAKGIAIRLGR